VIEALSIPTLETVITNNNGRKSSRHLSCMWMFDSSYFLPCHVLKFGVSFPESFDCDGRFVLNDDHVVKFGVCGFPKVWIVIEFVLFLSASLDPNSTVFLFVQLICLFLMFDSGSFLDYL